MKILQMCIHYPPIWGGIETFVNGLVESSVSRGHQVEVLSAHGELDLPDKSTYNGITVHRLPVLHGIQNKSAKILLQSIRYCRKVVHDFQPDIVHLHGGGAILMSYIMSPELKTLPMVLTMHDLPDGGPENNPSTVDLFRLARVIVTVSYIRYRQACSYVPQISDKIRCIYNGKPSLPEANDFTRSRTPLLLAVGRQVQKKGFDVAISAFSRLISDYPNLQLVLVGDGNQHTQLEDQVVDLGLENSVHFAGVVSREEMSQWYQKAWISLVTSRHSESFGLVALEAMQAGCVVVASNTGGLPEVIQDRETGLLFKTGSVSDLASAIEYLLKNPGQLHGMGQAGKARADNAFGWNRCEQEYDNIYQNLNNKRLS